jgi:hypothetical protein
LVGLPVAELEPPALVDPEPAVAPVCVDEAGAAGVVFAGAGVAGVVSTGVVSTGVVSTGVVSTGLVAAGVVAGGLVVADEASDPPSPSARFTGAVRVVAAFDSPWRVRKRWRGCDLTPERSDGTLVAG